MTKRKPPEQLRRRNAPEQWIVLPQRSRLAPPTWPLGAPSSDETALWSDLWSRPVAAWWHEQRLNPVVVARYVRVVLEKPGAPMLSKLENDLALTPASLVHLRLMVEAPAEPATKRESPFEELAQEMGFD
jgi:hypothetical protein